MKKIKKEIDKIGEMKIATFGLKERLKDFPDVMKAINQTRIQSHQEGREEVIREVEKIHKEHYSKWIPTEEQKGYRKAQLDIIKILSKTK